MGKATLVSLFPLPITEFRHGLTPSDYSIPASDGTTPQTLTIGDAHSYMYIDETRGNMKVPAPAEEVAESIINDFRSAHLYVSDGAYPALFWIKGDKPTPAEIKAAQEAQNRWYLNLVRIADDEWAKFHQHKMVTDLQKIAAQKLGLNREWLIENQVSIQCPACKTYVDPAASICKNCKCVLKPEEVKKLSFAGA